MPTVQPVTRTIYAALLQTSMLLRKTYLPLTNSTLNQRFDVHAAELPGEHSAGVPRYPKAAYIGIGNNGVELEMGTGGRLLTSAYHRQPRWASLFSPIPFRLVPIAEDLSPEERALYRMRVIVMEGAYVAYYLRVVDLSATTVLAELRDVEGANISAIPFQPTGDEGNSDLFPQPMELDPLSLNNPDGEYLVATAKLNVTLTSQDVQHIIEACEILYGDARYANISEVGMFSGVDRTLPLLLANGNNGPDNYVESIATQLLCFVNQFHALVSTTSGVIMDMDLGAVEPLLAQPIV